MNLKELLLWPMHNVGALLVIIGLVAEFVAELRRFEKNETAKRLILKAGVLIIILGVAVEIYESTLTEAKLAKAVTFAAQANERASTNELAAKQLELQLAETKLQLTKAETRLKESLADLKNENMPMDIGEQVSFANALKVLQGIQVKLRHLGDIKSEKTANDLLAAFLFAGWQVTDRGLIGDIGEDGVVIGYNHPSAETPAALLLKLLTERGIPAKIIRDERGTRVRGASTNTVIVAVCQRPTQLNFNLMLLQAHADVASDRSRTVTKRIFDLAAKQYVVGSRELAEAQDEYNKLNAESQLIDNERWGRFDKIRKLTEESWQDVVGTNTTPGIHMYRTRINNPPLE